jgi:hypothetical protein
MISLHAWRVASRFLAFVLSLAALGCGDTLEVEPQGPVTDELVDDGKFDRVSGELRVRAGDMTVWVDAQLWQASSEPPTWIIEGRASRNLAEVFSWVPDDAFGQAEIVSARRFRIALDSHEANSLLSGLPLLVSLRPTGAPERTHTARLRVEPGLGRFFGSSGVFVDQALQPVWLDGNVAYRTHVHVASGAELEGVTTLDGGSQGLERLDSATYRMDWSFERLRQVGLRRVAFVAHSEDGATLTKWATVQWVVARLGLTTEDPYVVWPSAECRLAVRRCLDGLPGSRRDTGACGSFREVLACGGPFAPPADDEVVGDEWSSCHAHVLSNVVACVYDWLSEPEEGMSVQDAIDVCTDAEALAGAYDLVCSREQPAPAWCSASYETFATTFGPICAEAARAELGS